MSELPQNLHRDIMRSVKVVKTRYYLYGVLSGFLAALVSISFVVYDKMTEEGSLDFLFVWFNSVKVDITEFFDFKEELTEFFPWQNLLVWLLVFIVVIILLLIIFRFRKVLFTKVDKFINEKK